MICVCIGRSRHRHLIAEHKHLVELGAELVELRLDYISGPINFKRLLKDCPGPIIVTCRRESDGGRFSGTEEQRQMILRQAIVEGVDYVDIEEDIAASIPRFGKTKRIISLHDFRKTPDDLESIHARMAALDADIVKITTMANSPHDNVRMLRLVRDAKIPTIGFCMGDIGIPSRVLSGRCGAPFVYSAFQRERTLAPGQLTFEEMRDIYRYDQIDDKTEVFGVIADPVGHSLSPLLHNRAFASLGMNRVYLPFRVPQDQLSQFFEDAAELGIRGLSVTIPHKEKVLELLTKSTDLVEGIGACNTVIFKGADRLGYNTDCTAAVSSIEIALGGEGTSEGKKVLLLGAGGAGRAIAFGFLKRGAEVTVSDVRADAAKRLASELDCKMVVWEERYKVQPDILINATPVGMHPNVDETSYDKDRIRAGMLVFDAVYNPESTLLIKNAKDRKAKVVTGVEMFVRQAAHQFKYFTGEEAPTDLMKDTVRRAISAVRY
jgi:3-dehydroquinate dehydratase / shikimate dehydrogenase